jgi:hypothetical protein
MCGQRTSNPNLKRKNALATQRIITINIKQTPPIQSSTQTHTDLCNSAMGDSLQFQHRNPTALSIQGFPIHSERTLVNKKNNTGSMKIYK